MPLLIMLLASKSRQGMPAVTLRMRKQVQRRRIARRSRRTGMQVRLLGASNLCSPAG
jgi:hypothetical protein